MSDEIDHGGPAMPDHSPQQLLLFLLQANHLKTTPRTGWALRGVPAPESVADHSHGVALFTLLLLDLVPDHQDRLDRQKALAMAILHDLPECITGDISLGASRHLPEGTKHQVENHALAELLADLPFAGRWRELWQEFEQHDSPEAQLVRDADRLDLLLQAHVYEQTTGNRCLDEFWIFAEEKPFAFAESRQIAEELAARRGSGRSEGQ
jgi:putative hydrolase of HD superfamily